MSADIYTKAFNTTAEWTRNLKLINHLDPQLFWNGRNNCDEPPIPSEHKGGVKYDYWTTSPWHQQPVPTATARSQLPLTKNNIQQYTYTLHPHNDVLFGDSVLSDDDYAHSEADDDTEHPME